MGFSIISPSRQNGVCIIRSRLERPTTQLPYDSRRIDLIVLVDLLEVIDCAVTAPRFSGGSTDVALPGAEH
jgi:hypothetical protein